MLFASTRGTKPYQQARLNGASNEPFTLITTDLFRQTHSVDQGNKARIASERIESGIHPDSR